MKGNDICNYVTPRELLIAPALKTWHPKRAINLHIVKFSGAMLVWRRETWYQVGIHYELCHSMYL